MAYVSLIDLVYPTGSIVMTTAYSTVNAMQTKFGGTWEQIKGGLIGAAGSPGLAANDKTGGSSTITVNNMPSHSHSTYIRYHSNGAGYSNNRTQWGSEATEYSIETSSTGGGKAYYPAHYSCYIFKRTA